jgi:hypothetical protein
MHTQITEQQYQQEIRHFVGLSIDRINILHIPSLHFGGFSLIHIIDEKKKQGKILSITGHIRYKNGSETIETKVNFDRESKDEKLFQDKANQIKQKVLKNSTKIKDFAFENNSGKVILTFDDASTLMAEIDDKHKKPLSYDDDSAKYVVYFGERISGDDQFNYFKTTFN